MSTSALRTLIQTGEAEVLPLDRIVREAKAELEAIEKAAQDLTAWGDIRPASRDLDEREAVGQAEMLLRRIAKESTP